MKSLILSLLLICLCMTCGYSQESEKNGRALNFPARKYGISIGNSFNFNGIRFNFSDRNVQKINGLNFTVWSRFKPHYNDEAIINGISAGIFTTASKMQPLNVFLFGAMSAQSLNGLSIAGLGIGSGKISGICLSGIFLEGGDVNGLSFAGLFSYSENSFNGLSLGGLAVASSGNINGVSVGLAGIYSAKTIKGLALTAGYLKSEASSGFTVAGYARINQVNGLSIALVNNSGKLHGMQIGLINYAGNNRKGLRLLPVMNFHFSGD